jgi:hypothetical protein
MAVALLSQNIIGQVKSKQLPTFKNPFQSKQAKSSDSILTPNQSETNQPKKYKIETVNGSFFLNYGVSTFDVTIFMSL